MKQSSKRSLVPNLIHPNAPQGSVLSDEQCEQLFEYALRILEETGVQLNHARALEILLAAGCRVEDGNVKIPANLVLGALSTIPESITIYNRDRTPAMLLEGKNTYFGPGPTQVNFKDVCTGERRKARKEDVVNTARVTDALENMDFVMGLGMIDDMEPTLSDLHELDAMLANSYKPVVTWSFGLENLKSMVAMIAAASGGLDEYRTFPSAIIYSLPVTPLTHPDDSLDKLMYMAELGLPQIYTPGALMGGTSPVTIAGTLAVNIADALVGIVLSQLINPGCPVISGSLGGGMDFRTMQGLYGAVEGNLQGMASTSFFHWLGLPVWGTAGCTDSKVVDAQAALDASIQILSFTLVGCNMVHDCGFTDSGMTANLDYLVVCDEIVAQVRRMMVGLEVNDDQVPLDVIQEVGPGGSYLTSKHTFTHFKKELYVSDLYETRQYEKWEEDGKKTLEDRAHEVVLKILDEHHPEPLDALKKEEITRILEERRAAL